MLDINKFILMCCLILTLTCICTLNNSTSYAASDFQIKNGVLLKYNGTSSNVTIPSNVKTIGEQAFSYNYNIKNVTIPNSVKTIKDSAFFCSSLETVSIPKSVTYIGNAVFTRCYNLKNIKVSSANKNYCSVKGSLFNKSKTRIMNYADGYNLTSYTIPSTVTTIDAYAFAYTNLERINLPQKLKTIENYAFAKNDSLKYLKIPEGVKKLYSGTFFLCRNLDYVQIPESLTYIEKGTFDDCGFWVNLTDIKGYTGSYAQTFAKNNNLKFISIGIGKVTNLKTTSRTNSSITLSWKKISGVSGYEIYRSTSKNKNYKKIATINNSKNTFKDSSLSKNKTYYYKVRAYKTSNGKKVYGSYSSVKSTSLK